MALRPNTELVSVSWLRSIPGIDNVGTTLPKDISEGFVQVTVVGGTPDKDLPMARPVIQIDTWAGKANSNKPPWGHANSLAELIRMATFAPDVSRLLTMGVGGYEKARVLSAYPVTEPRRIPDEGGYARYQFDLQIHWRVA
jgi:hypothetical protein